MLHATATPLSRAVDFPRPSSLMIRDPLHKGRQKRRLAWLALLETRQQQSTFEICGEKIPDGIFLRLCRRKGHLASRGLIIELRLDESCQLSKVLFR
jgi:hypothetical protein